MTLATINQNFSNLKLSNIKNNLTDFTSSIHTDKERYSFLKQSLLSLQPLSQFSINGTIHHELQDIQDIFFKEIGSLESSSDKKELTSDILSTFKTSIFDLKDEIDTIGNFLSEKEAAKMKSICKFFYDYFSNYRSSKGEAIALAKAKIIFSNEDMQVIDVTGKLGIVCYDQFHVEILLSHVDILKYVNHLVVHNCSDGKITLKLMQTLLSISPLKLTRLFFSKSEIDQKGIDTLKQLISASDSPISTLTLHIISDDAVKQLQRTNRKNSGLKIEELKKTISLDEIFSIPSEYNKIKELVSFINGNLHQMRAISNKLYSPEYTQHLTNILRNTHHAVNSEKFNQFAVEKQLKEGEIEPMALIAASTIYLQKLAGYNDFQ